MVGKCILRLDALGRQIGLLADLVVSGVVTGDILKG